MKQCTITGCELTQYAGGWCRKHHERNRKFGNPMGGRDRSRPLGVRFQEKVSVSDSGCWIWTGSKDRHGYGQIRVNGRLAYAHRVSFEMHHGPIADGQLIDHLCFNPACVNPSHLRPVSRRENNEHRQGAMSNNRSSGLRNVYPKRDKWQVRIKNKSFGVYPTLAEASHAAAVARAEVFTHAETHITTSSVKENIA